MSEARLKAEIWVKALMRRAWSQNVPALLMRRGEDSAGAVIIKMNGGPGSRTVIYARGLLADGRWGWRRASGKDALDDLEAHAYVERQVRFDSDLWVVEIEASDLTQFVDDPVEG
ncbi:DUF1491 family protein [Govanella unica]|uniref:DUF1491 family protein n=1 Tax=Govanella unica TaxID=2975056 RepID=A0A9X3TZK8_9PROT|nr:DUF1491 family protein [Govania unica]MDA5194592.1 DUF1491 family protein [Govania unica]